MTQMQSIRMRQPWTLLHDREDPKPRVDHASEVERAAAARKVEAALTRNRDRVHAQFMLCSRPYF